MTTATEILVTTEPEATGDIQLNVEPEVVDEKIVESALPEKFAGKSAEDIAQMYMNLESEHGRVANEFGNVRAQNEVLNDLLTKASPSAPVEPAVEDYEVDAASLLDDPQGTLEKWYETRSRSDREAYDGRIAGLESQLNSVQVRSRVTDFDAVIASPGFAEWVRQSPTRQRVAQAAGEGDQQAALTLVEEFKAIPVAEPVPADPAQDALNRAATLSLESPGDAGVAGDSNLPVFRASELRRLKATDYERYSDPDFQETVLLAYRDGRVK
jgi:hypothetical protein